MQKYLHQNKDNQLSRERLDKTLIEKGANLPLTMTDYIFLFGFFLVVFWAVDPFEWRLAYRSIIKHFPIIAISPAFFLTIAGVYLFPKRNKSAAVYSDNKVAIILLCVFATFVTLGSLYARLVKGIDNGFLTMGLYTLTAPLTVWFVRKAQNPVSVIKWMVLIYFTWSLVAVTMQIAHIGQPGYFHEREHLVISVLILMFYVVNTGVVQILSILFIIATALIARKNTAYMIMLMALAYMALVWAMQHAQKIKDKFSKWAFWLRNGLLGFALAITAIGVYFSVKSALPDGNPEYRLHTYEIAWNKFLSSPIWGTGFTAAATEKFDLFTVASTTQVLPTHSDPLDILAQGGLIGFLIWLAILFILLKQWFYLVLQPQQQFSVRVIPYLHTLYFLVFSGYFVCTFNPLLNNPSLAWTFWGAVGALFAVLRTESKKIKRQFV
jgi:O-antigen ligase